METTQIVYAYSLKQGIEDGYLTPYRVKIYKNKILDEYQYNPDDKIIQGKELLDKDKTYTEKDFYKGDIKIRQRDEDRVIEFMEQIEPNEKTIVFCATHLVKSIKSLLIFRKICMLHNNGLSSKKVKFSVLLI